jgi:hypothetical protein
MSAMGCTIPDSNPKYQPPKKPWREPEVDTENELKIKPQNEPREDLHAAERDYA